MTFFDYLHAHPGQATDLIFCACLLMLGMAWGFASGRRS